MDSHGLALVSIISPTLSLAMLIGWIKTASWTGSEGAVMMRAMPRADFTWIYLVGVGLVPARDPPAAGSPAGDEASFGSAKSGQGQARRARSASPAIAPTLTLLQPCVAPQGLALVD
jgi:hypothetical protein